MLTSTAFTRLLAVIWLLVCPCMGLYGQIRDAYGAHAVPRPDIGHEYIHLLNETVSPADGSVNISIDVPLPPGRGLTLPFSLSYNSGSVYTYQDSGQGNVDLIPDQGLSGRSHEGWEYSVPLLTYTNTQMQYDPSVYTAANLTGFANCYWTTNYMFADPSGARHPLGLAGAYSNSSPVGYLPDGLCPNPYNFTYGGDYRTVAHICWQFSTDGCGATQVATADGTVYSFPEDSGLDHSLASSVTDRNGNAINIRSNGITTTYTDELGRSALTLTANMNSYIAGKGVQSVDTITVPQYSQPIAVQWAQYPASGAPGHIQYLGGETDSGTFCSIFPPAVTGGYGGSPVDGISTITLPNGTQYKFTYDPTFGLIKRITYPNGGYVEYDWAMQKYFEQNIFSLTLLSGVISYPSSIAWSPPDGELPLPYYVNCQYAYDWPAVVARRVSFDGSTVALTQTFSYSASPLGIGGGPRTTTVTTTDNVANQTSITLYNYNITQSPSNDPLNFIPTYGDFVYLDQDIITLAQIGSSSPQMPADNPLESSIVYEDGAQNILKTVSKTWYNALPSDIEASETVTLGSNGPSSTTQYVRAWPVDQVPQTIVTGYDGSQRVTNVAYHTFCSITEASAANGPGACIASGQAIFDQPDSVQITTSAAANSPPVAETDYSNYDSHGNAGTVTKKCWLSGQNCADSITNYVFNSYGEITTQTDALGHSTNFNYTDNFTSGTAPFATDAYLTKITYPATNGVQHVVNFDYDYASGHINHAYDENGNKTTYTYADPLGRTSEVDYADGGKTTENYNDGGSSPTISVAQLAGPTRVTTFDGMFHATRTQVSGANIMTSYADTKYDGFGNVYSVSNPYYSTTEPTYGTTGYQYDALGRILTQCNPDNGTSLPCTASGNSFKAWSYNGNTTTFTDEGRNSWSRTTDAFGNLSSVVEPGGLTTNYAYDILNNLSTVSQLGGSGDTPRTQRSFTYDSLSRLLTSTNPATGTTCYGQWNGGNCTNGYDGNGNLLYKTDARGIVTSYTYDALNRLESKTYSDGTAPALFGYDGNNNSGVALSSLGIQTSNAIGRLSYMSNQANTGEAFGYDTMGRVNQQTDSLPEGGGWNVQISAIYDLAGNLAALVYPNNYIVGQTWDAAGHLTTSSLMYIGKSTANQTYLQSAQYYPDGTPAVLTLGNGAQEAFNKNDRLQMQSITIGSTLTSLGSSPFLSHTYCYVNCTSGGTANNDNIWQVADALNPGLTQDYTYDSLNRLTGFSLGGTPYQQYSIDSFGNMSANLSNGSPAFTFAPATNRISNLLCARSVTPQFDNAGNQVCDTDSNGADRIYAYDAEDRIASIRMATTSQPFETYIYNADGNRVQKANADGTYTDYVYFTGQPIAELDQNGNWTNYIYANGQRIARVDGNDKAMHAHATATATGYGASWFIHQLDGYTVKAGDRLSWRQYQSTNVVGGIDDIWFSNCGGIYPNDNDTTGQPINMGSASNVWQQRTIDLTPMAGCTVQSFRIGEDNASAVGDWDLWFADMAVTSTDGTVTPIYYRENSVSANPYIMDNVINASFTVDSTTVPTDLSTNYATTFYAADHLGTAQLEMSTGGWPVWKGTFAPYGTELSNLFTPNHYKFTGKERDTESGLDYFSARYYGSTMGRFMSPDPLGGHTEDPQTLNRYAYARNNPLLYTDPTGLDSYLQCTAAKDGSNASTCQSQTVGYDKNGNAQTATVQGVTKDGKFTATLIGNDASGNLVDKTTGTGAYTASVNGNGVQFSNNGGQTSSTGVFVNGTPQTTFQDAGFANGGALSGFQFTLTNSKMEANQTEAGSFSFNGTVSQAESALQKAGFIQRAGTEGGIEFRSPGSGLTGANSGHFIIDNNPRISVPTSGSMHFGEHNPYSPLGWSIHIPFEAPK